MRTAVFVNYNKSDPYLPPSLFAQQNQVVNQTTTVMMQTNTTPLVSKKNTLHDSLLPSVLDPQCKNITEDSWRQTEITGRAIYAL